MLFGVRPAAAAILACDVVSGVTDVLPQIAMAAARIVTSNLVGPVVV